MTKHTLDEEQADFLKLLVRKRNNYERSQERTAVLRDELNDMIMAARELGISTYRIAEKVGMSQPRIMQLANEHASKQRVK